jgi:1-acyl-sn-glycerol-3-phosphate acyltransferase
MFYHGRVDGMVQPVAIVIESVDGKNPDEQAVRDLYAWWKPEDTLAPHLWTLAKTSGANLSVHFLPVIDPKAFPDRKALAQAATQSVADALR